MSAALCGRSVASWSIQLADLVHFEPPGKTVTSPKLCLFMRAQRRPLPRICDNAPPVMRRNSIPQSPAAKGLIDPSLAATSNPLGFLIHDGGASSLVEAAYRYARHEPGVDVVLFGTGSIAHLRSNVASLLKPPLPNADRAKLAALFGHLIGIGLDDPQRPRPA